MIELKFKGEKMDRQKETGIVDTNCEPIGAGDKVYLFNQIGTVVFECGAYGIAFDETINYDYIFSQILTITGCDNNPYFCQNDNFISFWELLWNFNCEEDFCTVVRIVK